MVHGYEVKSAKFAVDMRYKLRDLMFELRRVRQRGSRDLYEYDVANPLRIILEESFECT